MEIMHDECQGEYLERHALCLERIRAMRTEETVPEPFRAYFRKMAGFFLEVEEAHAQIVDGSWRQLGLVQMQEQNYKLYENVLPENYGTSYANPSYAKALLGGEYGQILCALYAELRCAVPYAFEGRMDYLTILGELLIEVYNCFEEGVPQYQALKDIFYWYASDYCDVFFADRIEEQLYPEKCVAARWLSEADLDDLCYLYRYGEYVTENELGTARHLAALPEETVQKMADVYTEGYRQGFINTGKDLSKKSVVDVRYRLGFERVIKKAVENFRKMGLEPVIVRAAASVITKREQAKVGYYGAIANKQYEYDHRFDQALFLDKRYVDRKLDVMRNVYERNKDQAARVAGPAVMEVFGERPFSPQVTKEAASYSAVQQELSVQYEGKSGQITNQYIKGEERSFTIVAYPVPEIGERYKEIFDDVIRINTLDAKAYEKAQQALIDALDAGEYARVLGKGANRTDLTIRLHPLNDPHRETKFENCVADVNIPVGEVFTSPVLSGTHGVLHVSKVYLHELQYLDLRITFEDGMVRDYTCTNFENEEDNRKYVYDNVLHHHESLPIGEFAIGTNTTAYVVGRKYGIEDKWPILIAEKTGPHFAVGDTCYSWAEDVKVYNPDGKEIIARDNSVSILRKEDVSKAYFQCHTDITIPYEELGEISVVTKEGKTIILLKDGKFVLPGTEMLNEAFAEENS